MRTKTFFYPNEKEPTKEIEVNRDGSIIRGLAFDSDLDCWLDCTKELRERPTWTQRAAEFAAEANWNDHGDSGFDEFKERLAKIVGVKPA